MEVITLVISIVALVFALMGFGLALYTTIIHHAIKNSTHKIQYINPMTDKENIYDDLVEDFSMDEDTAKYNEEYAKEAKKEFSFFNDDDSEDNSKPKHIRGL